MEEVKRKLVELCEEDYLDDPITLFNIESPADKPLITTVYSEAARPTPECNSGEQEYSTYGKNSSITLPVTFFNNSNNLTSLGKCRALSVKLANCTRIPYCKKILKLNKKKKKKSKDKSNHTVNNFILDLFGVKKPKKLGKTSLTVAINKHKSPKRTDEKLDTESADKVTPKINFRENTGLLGMKITSKLADQNDQNVFSLAVAMSGSDKKNVCSNAHHSLVQSKNNSKTLKEVKVIKEKISGLIAPSKTCHNDETKQTLSNDSKIDDEKDQSSTHDKHKKPRSDKGTKRSSSSDSSKEKHKSKLPNTVKNGTSNPELLESHNKSSKQKEVKDNLVGTKIKFSAVLNHNEQKKKKYYTKDYSIQNYNSEKHVNNDVKLKDSTKPTNEPKSNCNFKAVTAESKVNNKPNSICEAKRNVVIDSSNNKALYHNLPNSKLNSVQPTKDSTDSIISKQNSKNSSSFQYQDKFEPSQRPDSIINKVKEPLILPQIDDRLSSCPTPKLTTIFNNDIKVHTVDEINSGFNLKPGQTDGVPTTNSTGPLLSVHEIKKEKCEGSVQIKQEIIEDNEEVPSHAPKVNNTNVNLVKPMPNEKIPNGNSSQAVQSQRDQSIYNSINYTVPPQNSLLIPLPHGPPPTCPLGPYDYPPPKHTNYIPRMMQYSMNPGPYNEMYSNLVGPDGYQQFHQPQNNNHSETSQNTPVNATNNQFNMPPTSSLSHINPNTVQNMSSRSQNLPSELQNITCDTRQSSGMVLNPPCNLSSKTQSPVSNVPVNNNMLQNTSIQPPNISTDMSWYQPNVNHHFPYLPPNFISPMNQSPAPNNVMMQHNNMMNFMLPPPPPPPANTKNNAKKTTVIRVASVSKMSTLSNHDRLKGPLLPTPSRYPTINHVLRQYLLKKQPNNTNPSNNTNPNIQDKIPPPSIISITKDKLNDLTKIVESISLPKVNTKQTESQIPNSNRRVVTSASSGSVQVTKKIDVESKNAKKISLDDYMKRTNQPDDQCIVDLCD